MSNKKILRSFIVLPLVFFAQISTSTDNYVSINIHTPNVEGQLGVNPIVINVTTPTVAYRN